jgi:hypothetical protein
MKLNVCEVVVGLPVLQHVVPIRTRRMEEESAVHSRHGRSSQRTGTVPVYGTVRVQYEYSTG